MYLRNGNSRHEREEKTLGLYRHLGKSMHLEDRMNGLELFLRAVDKILDLLVSVWSSLRHIHISNGIRASYKPWRS